MRNKGSYFFLVIAVFLILITACSSKETKNTEATLEFYKNNSSETGTLSGKVTIMAVDTDIYALIKNNKPFENESIGMNISQVVSNNKTIIGGTSIKIDPKKELVVLPFKISNPGEYEISVYIKDPDEPLVNSRINIVAATD